MILTGLKEQNQTKPKKKKNQTATLAEYQRKPNQQDEC